MFFFAVKQTFLVDFIYMVLGYLKAREIRNSFYAVWFINEMKSERKYVFIY